MSVIQVDNRHRITLPKEIRKKFRIVQGQKFYVVPFGKELLMKPVPENPARKLDELVGEFKFDRHARRKAEKWLFENTNKRQNKS